MLDQFYLEVLAMCVAQRKIQHYNSVFLPHKMTQVRGFFCLGGGRGLSTALQSISKVHIFCRKASCSSPDGLVKHTLQIALRKRRAFQVLLRFDLATDLQRFFISYR